MVILHPVNIKIFCNFNFNYVPVVLAYSNPAYNAIVNFNKVVAPNINVNFMYTQLGILSNKQRITIVTTNFATFSVNHNDVFDLI